MSSARKEKTVAAGGFSTESRVFAQKTTRQRLLSETRTNAVAVRRFWDLVFIRDGKRASIESTQKYTLFPDRSDKTAFFPFSRNLTNRVKFPQRENPYSTGKPYGSFPQPNCGFCGKLPSKNTHKCEVFQTIHRVFHRFHRQKTAFRLSFPQASAWCRFVHFPIFGRLKNVFYPDF